MTTCEHKLFEDSGPRHSGHLSRPHSETGRQLRRAAGLSGVPRGRGRNRLWPRLPVA